MKDEQPKSECKCKSFEPVAVIYVDENGQPQFVKNPVTPSDLALAAVQAAAWAKEFKEKHG